MRQFSPFTPLTQASSAAARDPRAKMAQSYDPQGFSDEQQFADQQQAFAANNIPLSEVIERLDNMNVPPQITMAPFFQKFTTINVPQLLLPYNRNRMAFIIVNTSLAAVGDVMNFSFGRPTIFSAGNPVGITLTAGQIYQEGNGTVTINEIWAWGTTIASTFFILAYEGTLSIAGKFGGMGGNVK